MDIKNPQGENLNVPERKVSAEQHAQEARKEWEPEKEKKEISQDEKIISDELKREIELMNVDDNLKKDAEQKANTIRGLADDDKLKKLLEIAKEKGVLAAITMAKAMNDPFLLDTLHDILAKEGYYQKFLK